MEKHLLRKLRVLQNMDAYPSAQPVPGQDPRETLAELLEAKRVALAEALLKTAVERWSSTDSLVAMAMSCVEAASVIYPELEPEESEEIAGLREKLASVGLDWDELKRQHDPTPRPNDTYGPAPTPLPTREGMLSVGGFVPAHEREGGERSGPRHNPLITEDFWIEKKEGKS